MQLAGQLGSDWTKLIMLQGPGDEADAEDDVAPPPAAGGDLVIDHVRLAVTANHGHPGYTCVYRIRVHGTPAGR